MEATLNDPYALSVVLPVHAGVDPAHLRRALTSVYDQSLLPQEIVLVEDGPLSPDHHDVLEAFAGSTPPLHRLTLSENQGAAVANQAGLNHASAPWIAKMDADDIAVPARFEFQVEALRTEKYDLVGAAMLEFEGDEDNVIGVRQLPSEHRDIARYMRMNNPINHPTAVYRREMAIAAGGYQSMRFMQDYDFFARMLVAGARMHNLAEPLVLFRADPAMFRRRRSAAMFRCELTLQQRLRSYGLIGRPRMIANLAVRSLFRLLPAGLMRRIYRRLFHAHRPD